MNWSNFPENSPKEAGYYFTYYYNENLKTNFYKCLFWDIENKEWIYPTSKFSVKKFIEQTKSRYHRECVCKISRDPKCDELCPDWMHLDKTIKLQKLKND